MAGIQWTASTINTFFNTSLNRSNTDSMSGLYSCLGDASLIKKGTYSKLMKSYYAEIKKQDTTTDKTNKTDKTDKTDKAETTDKNSKTETNKTSSTTTSKTNTTYDSNGVKQQTTQSLLDTLV